MSEEITVDTVQTPIAQPTPPAAQPKPEGKVFTEDYVSSLREEAKNNRIKAKNLEAKIKSLIGLKDDEDVDDSKITAYQAKQTETVTAALAKANARLLSAEIKALDGYDAKLVEALLASSPYKSEVTITDDGTVTGLAEVIAKLEAEFPQIKKQTAPNNPANPPGTTQTEVEKLQADYDEAIKRGDTVTAVMLKNKLFSAKK